MLTYTYIAYLFLTLSRVFLASLVPSLCHAFSLTYPPLILHSPAHNLSSNSNISVIGVLWAPIVAWWHLFQRMTMVHCKQKMYTKFLDGKFLASDNLEDHKVDVRIILNHVLRKYVLRMWISTLFPMVWSSGKISFCEALQRIHDTFNRWISHN